MNNFSRRFLNKLVKSESFLIGELFFKGPFKTISLQIKTLIVSFFLILFGYTTKSWAQLVTQAPNGDLVYQAYANRGQTNAVNTVPDFSYAGYGGGGVAIPNVPVKVVVNPVSGDDGVSIQAAIDQVSAMSPDANGFRGAVLLKAGTYQVEGSINIVASGVVLRGEGQGSTGGTKIIATGQDKRSLINASSFGSAVEMPNTSANITQTYVPVGSNTITVSSVSTYNVGDNIMVYRTPNQTWLDVMEDMDQWGWKNERFAAGYERKITAINGNTLTLNAPIVQTIEDQYGGGRVFKYTYPTRINKIGIENLRLESEFDSNTDETHAWNGVSLNGIENSWVRKVTSQYFGYACVNVQKALDNTNEFSNSRYITVEDCAMLDPKSLITGSRRYSFVISSTGGQFILFQRCYTRSGRHDYVVQAEVSGPNVFLDCVATDAYSEIGPHHRYATGNLFDNIRGGRFEVRNRAGSGGGHGWAGAQTMFWNCQSTSSDGNSGASFNVSSPTTARNWAIGNSIGGTQKGNGYWESVNTPVLPRSLYLAQLEERLGTSAVNNVTIPEQRTGRIWDALKAWAGEGNPPGSGSSIALDAVADAFVKGGTDSGTNYGSANLMVKNGSSGNVDRESFIRFDLNGLEGNATQALLVLRVESIGGESVSNRPIDLKQVSNDSWDENLITWNTKPSKGVSISSFIVTSSDVGNDISIDVTDYVNAQRSGDGFASFVLDQPNNANALVRFSSKENGSAPRLEVTGTTLAEQSKVPVADAFVNGGTSSGTNYGTANLMVKNGSSDNVDRESFIRFDVSDIDLNLGEAVLFLRVESIGGESVTNRPIELRKVSNDSWNENQITWNTKPSYGTLISSFNVTSSDVGNDISINVSDYVNAERSGDGYASFVLVQPNNANALVRFSSKESGNPPRLDFSEAPVFLKATLQNEQDVVTDSKILIYPNPVVDILHFQYLAEKDEDLNVRLIDFSGKVLLTKEYKASDGLYDFELNVSSMPKGAFIFQINGNQVTSRILIKR